MTPLEGSGAITKFAEAVKNFPAWLLTACAVATGVLLFVPNVQSELPREYRAWIMILFVLFVALAAFKWLDIGVAEFRAWRVRERGSKLFHLTPLRQSCFWAVSKQSDGSTVTQICADFLVKCLGERSVGLVRVRLVKPRIRGEVLAEMITVRHQRGGMHGTPEGRDYRIEPGTVIPARATVMVRGSVNSAEDRELQVTLGISDDEGHELQVRVLCSGRAPKHTREPIQTLESLDSVEGEIEKNVASVLQAELVRYEKNGRQGGGLGSLHIVYGERNLNQFGGDSWTPNSPTNQEIVLDPDSAELRSDNLDALLALRRTLSDDEQLARFSEALLQRLDADRGYARVAYFIVCALWKTGMLDAGLQAALFGLPEKDQKDFGISNIMMLMNGLLRYRHPDFDLEDLDALLRFIRGSDEHTFRISQKVAGIRAHRLLAGT